MYLLDVIVAAYLPSTVGWVFLGVVVIVEALILSRMLARKWFMVEAYVAAIFSNALTTFIGILAFAKEGKWGHLLNWLPITEYHGRRSYYLMALVLLASFLGSVLIESVTNKGLIRNMTEIQSKPIVHATLMANIVTYISAVVIFVCYMIFDPKVATC